MAIDRFRTSCALGAALILAGCATDGGASLASTDTFGEATRQTLAAQIIDPAPEYDTPQATTSGDQVAGATERYRTGKVKQPDRQVIGPLGKQGGGAGMSTGGN